VTYELVEQRVLVRDLEVGMFICRLDRHGTATPFPWQGLAVPSPAAIEPFRSSLGGCPTGSLVELFSGEIAIVMVQNHARRLLPRIAVLTTKEKTPLDDFRIVDLMRQVGHEHVEGSRSLPPGSHGIDPKEFFLQ
jgi:hypothetical protein